MKVMGTGKNWINYSLKLIKWLLLKEIPFEFVDLLHMLVLMTFTHNEKTFAKNTGKLTNVIKHSLL